MKRSEPLVSEQDFSIGLRNSRKQPIKVYLEPWGEVYPLEPDKMLRIDATGPVGTAPNNILEIHSSDDGITLWGWSGSGVRVHRL
jgi:hypothetical protein